MAKKLSLKEAKERAGRFCAYRERSPNEVLKKSKSWGLSQVESVELISELIRLNFIDEERFANAYCNDKFEFNSWGKQKIKANIYAHQISERIIDLALDRIDENKYKERLLLLTKKKWERLLKDEPLKRKEKTASYLVNKGFELDLIWKAFAILERSKGQ